MHRGVERGRRGERYVSAGRRFHLGEAYRVLERVTGVAVPRRRVPTALRAIVATPNELWARFGRRACCRRGERSRASQACWIDPAPTMRGGRLQRASPVGVFAEDHAMVTRGRSSLW